jgi:Spy/CpxP family protein refolding chaperone
MKARLFLATTVLMVAPMLVAQSPDTPTTPPAGQPPAPAGVPPQHRWPMQGRDSRGQMPERGMDKGREMRGHEMMHGHDGGPMGPPGMWWRNADLVAKVGLSPEQVKHIDEIFLQSRMKLIDLHASLEKEQLVLEPLMNANPVDQKKALMQIDKIADERAELEKTDAGMLLSIRGVLTADQWTKLQADHGTRGMHDMHGKGGPAEMDRGPRGGRGPGMAPPPSDDDDKL